MKASIASRGSGESPTASTKVRLPGAPSWLRSLLSAGAMRWHPACNDWSTMAAEMLAMLATADRVLETKVLPTLAVGVRVRLWR